MVNGRVLLIVGLVVVIVGVGIGTAIYAVVPTETRVIAQATATPVTPTPAPTLGPAPTPTGANGSTLRLAGIADYGYSLIWVNRTGLWAWNRAYDERDDRGMSSVMSLYETLRVPDRTLVRVVARDAEAVQVEILEGSLAGRRGWTDHPVAASDLPTSVPATPVADGSCALCGQRRRLHRDRADQWAAARGRMDVASLRRATRSDAGEPGWVTIYDGQVVTVIRMDSGAAEVELFGGQVNGMRVWVPSEDLGN